MKPDQAIQTIETFLAAEFLALQLTYLTEEEDIPLPLDASTQWVRSEIDFGVVKEIEIGRTGASTRSVELRLIVYTGPKMRRQAAKIAGDCEGFLRRKSLGQIEFGEPETLPQKEPKASRETFLVKCKLMIYQ